MSIEPIPSKGTPEYTKWIVNFHSSLDERVKAWKRDHLDSERDRQKRLRKTLRKIIAKTRPPGPTWAEFNKHINE